MKRVLIVSPHFPPFNGADMHRVRQSLPYFANFGWEVVTLAVDPSKIEGNLDEDLLATVPVDANVRRVSALNYRWTRKFGLGSLALRSLPFLLRAGSTELLKAVRMERPFDLVYFSTTQYPVLILGAYWKRRFGVPYVVDVQDPWRSDHYLNVEPRDRPPKFWLSYTLDRMLEPIGMGHADGLISVSDAYVDTLAQRYPDLAGVPAAVIPFGGATADFEALERMDQDNPIYDPNDGFIHAVYVGRGGYDMETAAYGLFGAMALGRARRPDLYDRLRVHFIGTDYAPGDRARKTIEPLAKPHGVEDLVREHPQRVPYFTALQLLRQADLLVIPGSSDPAYTASKLYPYILAQRPLLAIFNAKSSVVDVLARTGAGVLVTFNDGRHDKRELAEAIYEEWTALLSKLPFVPSTNWSAFEPYTAREMTRRQVELFERVIGGRPR